MTITQIIKPILYITLLLNCCISHAEEVNRADFVSNFSEAMTKQLCEKKNSPFASIYKGQAKDCQPALSQYVDICSEKVIPSTLDPQKEGIQGVMALSQCLIAHYQGGDVLSNFNKNASTSLAIDKNVWLTNLKPVMNKSMCEQSDSDFGKVYKGNNCPQDVDTLFTRCTTNVDNVVIPEQIDDLAAADYHAQIIAACITAHYVGGDALENFLSFGVK